MAENIKNTAEVQQPTEAQKTADVKKTIQIDLEVDTATTDT